MNQPRSHITSKTFLLIFMSHNMSIIIDPKTFKTYAIYTIDGKGSESIKIGFELHGLFLLYFFCKQLE